MSGTKQIRLGKALRFIECLEMELRIQKETLEKLSLDNPARDHFVGQAQQLESTINQAKRWFKE